MTETIRKELSYQKAGYLDEDFKLFYITDKNLKTFEYHYHDFHKILIFLQGNVSYVIEGKQYDLKPEDIILVQAGEIHRPIIHDASLYERIIIYVSPSFFENCKTEGDDLFHCFSRGSHHNSSLIRLSTVPNNPPSSSMEQALVLICKDLAASFQDKGFAHTLYQKTKFMEFLILLNRIVLQEQFCYTDAMTSNPVVQNILKYINDHISEDTLSVDTIAKAAFLNRSYLMHLFKEETGYTIGKYISEKRLFLARSCIMKGMSVTDACYHSGFKNYSAFYYAYKNKYGTSPKN